jgi:hypothetical protein
MESHDGFVPFHYDPRDGSLYLEVSFPGEEFFYNSFMASGVGLAFALGQVNWMASGAVVHFERRGDELILVEKVIRKQDQEEPGGEGKEVDSPQAFLQKSFPIVAKDGDRVLVDGTDYFIQDVSGFPGQEVSGVPARLASLFGEDGFQLDLEKSRIFWPVTRATTRSTEIEVLLTFVTEQPGAWAATSLTDPTRLVLRQRHSLSRLPSTGFEGRKEDPRMGSEGPFVCRWRLEKRDPNLRISKVRKPIVFYLDTAMPEVILESCKAGIEYWNTVFRNVGFEGAIEMRELPPDADPLDPRFPAVVLWRPSGVSAMGLPVVDPRTGQIVKAIILVDGYKERLQLNRYLALEPGLESGQPDLAALQAAMRTWIIAHEVGHVIASLDHNSGAPSVMDFLGPRFRANASGRVEVDLSLLAPAEPFPCDEWMIRYAYIPFSPDGVEEGLRRIVEEGLRKGLQFESYSEMNPRSGRIHYDDPLTVLEEDMAVRRILLNHFGPEVLRPDEHESFLFERLIPVYFHHRHSLRAAMRVLGGVNVSYDIQQNFKRQEKIIGSHKQWRALNAILQALSPEELLIPSRIATQIPAKMMSSPLSELEWPVREPGVFSYITNYYPLRLPLATDPEFDSLGWAKVLSDSIVKGLLDKERLARVAANHSSGQTTLSVRKVLDHIIEETWGKPTPEDPILASLHWIPCHGILDDLLTLARDDAVTPGVREAVVASLKRLRETLRNRISEDPAESEQLDTAIETLAGLD